MKKEEHEKIKEINGLMNKYGQEPMLYLKIFIQFIMENLQNFKQ